MFTLIESTLTAQKAGTTKYVIVYNINGRIYYRFVKRKDGVEWLDRFTDKKNIPQKTLNHIYSFMSSHF